MDVNVVAFVVANIFILTSDLDFDLISKFIALIFIFEVLNDAIISFVLINFIFAFASLRNVS